MEISFRGTPGSSLRNAPPSIVTTSSPTVPRIRHTTVEQGSQALSDIQSLRVGRSMDLDAWMCTWRRNRTQVGMRCRIFISIPVGTSGRVSSSRADRGTARSICRLGDCENRALLQLSKRIATCEASDLADKAAEIIAAEGATFTTRFGEPRAHPACAIERDSRNALRQHLRELRITDPNPADTLPRLDCRS